MSVSLSKRLATVFRRIGSCDTLADVGCDHGKLAVRALQEGVCDRAIATDVSAPSLTKAAILADKCGVDLECRVGDGLEPLAPREADLVVIAGLGGKEIVDILHDATWSPLRVMLVPHRDAPWVRKYLLQTGYRIDYDVVLTDAGHDYWMIDASLEEDLPHPDLASLDQMDPSLNWYVGRDARGSEDWEDYRLRRIAKIDRELSMGSRNKSLEWEKKYLV